MNKIVNQTLEQKEDAIDQDLVEIAGYHAYKYYKNRKIISVNKNKYIVKNSEYNDPTGLDALTVQKVGTKELTVVFVGTDISAPNGKQDLLTDIQLLSSKTPSQLKAADGYYVQMKDTYEKKGFKITSTCGNSLGGGLADYIGLLHPEVKTVTLNPALLPEEVVDGNLKYSNITNYFSRYDPLTLAERSGHLDGRIPGDHFIINNGIPLFSDLASNHTGYVQGSLDEQFYVVGVKGQPGYGKIYIDADKHVVTSIFTGAPLYGGMSKHVDINPYYLNLLANSLKNDVLDIKFKRAQDYLSNSKDIVEEEGRKLTQRISKVQSKFEEELEIAAGSALFKNISRTTNHLHREIETLITLLDLAEEKSRKLNQIVNSPPMELVEHIFHQSWDVESIFDDARHHLRNLSQKCYDLSHGGNYILTRLIPNLFKGGTAKFVDVVVGELRAHYQIIFRNEEKVKNQILEFRKQVSDTAAAFQRNDESIATTIANKTSHSTIYSAQQTNKYLLEKSHYMALGLKFKEITLKLAFDYFHVETSKIVYPLLILIRQTALLFENALEVIIDAIKVATNVCLYSSVPTLLLSLFTSYDDRVRSAVNQNLDPLEEAKETIRGVRKALDRLIANYPHFISSFKPYLDSALFNKFGYNNINLYNTSANNLLDEMELLFKDIVQQLISNKGNAITALEKVSESVLKNIKMLHSQVALVTMNP